MAPERATTEQLNEAAAERVHAYARAIVAGEIVAGRLVRRACERHLADLERGPARGLRFDAQRAGRAIRFFPMAFRHYKGEWGAMPGVRAQGLPIELGDWQAFLVGSLFGWQRRDLTKPDDHPRAWVRRFRRFYLEVAKKNGKSLMAAGLAVILTFFDGEPAAEGYTAATKRDQAALPWKDSRALIHASPALRKRIEGHEPKKTVQQLYDASTSSFLKPLSSEAGSEEGINPHVVIVDELHRAKDRGLNDMLVNSTGARAQPVFGQITTAGEIGESIWAEEHDYAEQVVEGNVDNDEMLVLIYMIDEDDDPFDEAVWPKANPNLGVSVNIEDMRARASEAKASPAKLTSFLRLRLNRRTSGAAKFFDITVWDRNKAAPIAAEQADAWGGLDLGWSRDISAFALWIPDGGFFDLIPLLWIPAEGAELRRSQHRIPYHAWERNGHVKFTDGNVRDDDVLYDDILALCRRFEVRRIKYDRAMASNLVPRLKNAGLELEPMAQGFLSLSGPTKELDRQLQRGRVRHGGHPVLRWMATNATARWDDNNNVRIQKPHGDSPNKVDGISATVNAIGAWIDDVGEEDSESVYETRGATVISLDDDWDDEDDDEDDDLDEDDEEEKETDD